MSVPAPRGLMEEIVQWEGTIVDDFREQWDWLENNRTQLSILQARVTTLFRVLQEIKSRTPFIRNQRQHIAELAGRITLNQSLAFLEAQEKRFNRWHLALAAHVKVSLATPRLDIIESWHKALQANLANWGEQLALYRKKKGELDTHFEKIQEELGKIDARIFETEELRLNAETFFEEAGAVFQKLSFLEGTAEASLLAALKKHLSLPEEVNKGCRDLRAAIDILAPWLSHPAIVWMREADANALELLQKEYKEKISC
jgi:hypothetical protein